ncbi:MAG: polysaccharide pyruvyl transferase family protein [Clostridia bacterium]|nr:polysaccharide pyruvyl transferase family protein [Clostridia bacterium]
MNKLFLCGHTGSDNRGCEAIVRSTIGIFNKAGFEDKAMLATFAPVQDKARGIDKIAELLPYGEYKNKAQRAISAAVRKVFKSKLAGQNIIQKTLWSKISQEALVLNIGGDIYCYSTPTVSMALNKYCEKKGAYSVLWGCTVEADRFGKDVIRDLLRYDVIVARESMTVNALKKVGVNESRILCCCDPAFTLETEKTSLPQGFVEGNTVGINVSCYVSSQKTLEAVCYLVEKIINETDMNVCFIPHVYNVQKCSGDLALHKKLLKKLSFYKDRICAVEADLSCTELKYIISKCRFFVGARTHSIIAAYSSEVPALALGYSMKSVGIAADIFRNAQDYVLSYKDIENKADIYNKFSVIMKNEEKIKAHYKSFMPDYVKTVEKQAGVLMERYLK